MIDLLWSEYRIDGIRMDSTPGAMLCSASGKNPETIARAAAKAAGAPWDPIIDERVDPEPEAAFSAARSGKYLEAILGQPARIVPIAQAASYTRGLLARALVDAIWRAGHFRLGDLAVSAAWQCDIHCVGGMAALYESVEAACDTLDGLGIGLKRFSVSPGKRNALSFKVCLSSDPEWDALQDIPEDELTAQAAEEDLEEAPGVPEIPVDGKNDLVELPAPPRFSARRKCPATLSGDEQDWIIFIPFDTCAFRLGGSMLAQATGKGGGKAPDLLDVHYFIDSYEVVRELVEDGIVTAGVTVWDGGLMTALRRLVPEGKGIRAEIGGLRASYSEADSVRILFGEVPGALIEIRDADYDFLDAELLLQDIAYYPLGHAGKSVRSIHAATTDPSDITGILQSLLDSQASEGED